MYVLMLFYIFVCYMAIIGVTAERDGDCGQGTYVDTIKNECVLCPKGRYNSELNAASCIDKCPMGTYRDQFGGRSTDDCMAW